MQIRMKMLLSTLALVILPLLIVGMVSYNTTSDSLKEQTNLQVQTIAQKTVDQIEDFLSYAQTSLEALSVAPFISLSFMQYRYDMQLIPEELEKARRQYPYFSQIRLVTLDGKEILSTLESKRDKVIDISGEKWVQEIQMHKGDKPYFTDIYVSKELGNPVLTMAKFVYDTNEQANVGILAIDIDAKAITQFVKQIKIGESGYAFMINKDGLILFHPEKRAILKDNLSKIGNPRFREIVTEKMMKGRQGYDSFLTDTRENIFVYYISLPRFRWSIGIAIPSKELFAKFFKLRTNLFIITVISIIIATLISLQVSRAVSIPIRQVLVMLREIAKGGGDLTKRLAVSTKDEVGELAQWFNKFIDTLQNMVSQVRSTAEQVSASSQSLSTSAQQMNASTVQISGTIQQVSKGVTEQASKIENTSKIMGDMSSTVKQVASNAQAAATASEKATHTAQEGGELAHQAVERMSKIDEVIGSSAEVVKRLAGRSKQISEILDVLTSIADQTNLLALNAAIEAARAGEAGRGFAVVAEEVRKLAERSAVSAKDIGKLVVEIQKETKDAVISMETGTQEVSQGAQIVNAVGQALSQIVKAAQEASQMVSQIATATVQQLEGTEKVVTSVNEIASIAEESASAAQEASSSTQEQTASMQEMSSGAQELSRAALNLKELVVKFKLKEKET